MDKLLIVEGVPGSGKTTFARRLGDRLSARTYLEGEAHPCDTAWCARMTEDEFLSVCDRNPRVRDALTRAAMPCAGGILLPYANIPGVEGDLYRYFESKELYDGRADKDTFCRVHRERWSAFGTAASGVSVFECALLQNAVNEMTLFHLAEEDEIFRYVSSLLSGVSRLCPMILYLDVDVRAAVSRAAEERLDGDGNRAWENGVIEYVARSPYGMRRGYAGREGMLRYFDERKEREMSLLRRLGCRVTVIPVDLSRHDEITNDAITRVAREIGC